MHAFGFSVLHWVGIAAVAVSASADGTDAVSSASSSDHCGVARQALTGELFGTLEGTLEAVVDSGVCSGQERPTGSGIRLRFRMPGGDDLPEGLVILGIDTIKPEDKGSGYRTTVTLIDEDHQLFYSTGELDSCFSDIDSHEVLKPDVASIVSGNVWCTRAIPAVNASGSVRIRNWRFDGVVRWRDG